MDTMAQPYHEVLKHHLVLGVELSGSCIVSGQDYDYRDYLLMRMNLCH